MNNWIIKKEMRKTLTINSLYSNIKKIIFLFIRLIVFQTINQVCGTWFFTDDNWFYVKSHSIGKWLCWFVEECWENEREERWREFSCLDLDCHSSHRVFIICWKHILTISIVFQVLLDLRIRETERQGDRDRWTQRDIGRI